MPQAITAIAVFCGSSSGNNSLYEKTAYEAGAFLALEGLQVIYGGSQLGLMGAVANGALSRGGKVTGVIPGFLSTKEIAHTGITELIVVDNMHERKLRMHALSDAIIALPGGWGTMEELTEMLTWGQLGLHTKPIGLLNIGGYYDGFIQLIATMHQEGFLREEYMRMLIVADNIVDLISRMRSYIAPPVPQWITEETT
jgi:uncharacterized protein (TIGR00730 family)